MDVADHFRTIWSHRLVVLLGALAAAIAVFAWRSGQPTTFEAETTLRVVASGGATRDSSAEDAIFAAQGYAQRATTTPILAAAATRVDPSLTADDLADRVTAETDPDSGAVRVSAEGPSAEEAAAAADAIAAVLTDTVADEQQAAITDVLSPLRAEVADLEAQLSAMAPDDPRRVALAARHEALISATLNQELRGGEELTIVAPADPTSDPVAPHPMRDALLAFVVALIIIGELVVAVSVLGDRFSRAGLRDDVAATSGLPVLATVPRWSATAGEESYQELRTNLSMLQPQQLSPVFAVLGIEAGVGCSHTAIGLARAASLGPRPALLVDGNVRQPAIHERLDVPLRPGLTETLVGAETIAGVRPTGEATSSLYVLAAGAPLEAPAVALAQHFEDRVLTPARQRVGFTVVDAPPVTALADAVAIAERCDATILVIDAGQTSRRALRDVLGRLAQVGVEPLGVVINRAPWPSAWRWIGEWTRPSGEGMATGTRLAAAAQPSRAVAPPPVARG